MGNVKQDAAGNTLKVLAGGGYGSVGDAAWQLATTNFITQRVAMTAVYPRPNVETQAHARHRYAHPSINYRIPVGVLGGAWPFQYEITSGPTGATIGAHYGDTDYGVINWTAPASGTFSFTVRVTDQEAHTVDLTWSGDIDATKFVFIQDGWAGTKTGTIAAPLEDISDWYLGDSDDSTYLNKIVVFRGGAYTLTGDTVDENDNVRLKAATKTPSLIAYSGETPVINCSTAKIFTDDASLKDLFVEGITWQNARQTVTNAHFFWCVGDVTRSTFFGNTFDNMGPGTVGNDNTNCVFLSSTTAKDYHLYKGNDHVNIAVGGYNGGCWDAYGFDYTLVEENTVSDSTFGACFNAKATVNYMTMRANQVWDNVDGSCFTVGFYSSGLGTPSNHEICWNRGVITSTAATQNTVMMVDSNSHRYNSTGTHVYRNTLQNGVASVRFEGSDLHTVDANVVINSHLGNLNDTDAAVTSVTFANIKGAIADAKTTTAGVLTGASRTSYLGTKGHEVSA